MPAPAYEEKRYADLLVDRSIHLLDAQIEWWIKDLHRSLKAPKLPLRAAVHYREVLAVALARLGRHEEALATLEEALKIDPNAIGALSSIGAALLGLKRYDDALDALVTAAEAPEGKTIQNYLNLAEAFARLGQFEDARAVFTEAVELGDLNAPSHLYSIAASAASIGLGAEAIELFARYLALQTGESLGETTAVEFIGSRLDDVTKFLGPETSLLKSLAQALSFETERARLAGAELEGENDDDVLAVFETMRSSRQRATSASMSEAVGG